MDKQKLVVIGAGMASGRALEHLFDADPDGWDVTLFNAVIESSDGGCAHLASVRLTEDVERNRLEVGERFEEGFDANVEILGDFLSCVGEEVVALDVTVTGSNRLVHEQNTRLVHLQCRYTCTCTCTYTRVPCILSQKFYSQYPCCVSWLQVQIERSNSNFEITVTS